MALGQASIQIDGISFYYQKQEDYIVLTGAARLSGFVTLPERIEELPVKIIEKKAFLGQGALRQITVPKTVILVREWGFAQCRNLEKVILLGKANEIEIEKGAFVADEKLSQICVGTEEETDAASLLACSANRLSAEYLLTDRGRGSKDWFQKWDRKLSEFLAESDEEGYSKLALCGEEDIMLNIPQFMAEKRMQKAALCLIRLFHNENLESNRKEEFQSYILRYTKGCKTQEAWEVLLKEFIKEIAYLKLFADLGGVSADNIDEALIDLGSEFAEAKGFLLRYKEEHFAKKDAFAGFAL